MMAFWWNARVALLVLLLFSSTATGQENEGEPFPLSSSMEGIRPATLEEQSLTLRPVSPKNPKDPKDLAGIRYPPGLQQLIFQDGNNFLVDGNRIVFLTQPIGQNRTGIDETEVQFQIFSADFPQAGEVDENSHRKWVRPDTRLLATINISTNRSRHSTIRDIPTKYFASLLTYQDGKLFFYVCNGDYDSGQETAKRQVVTNGLYVADENEIRKIKLPDVFGSKADPTTFVRYPVNDQMAQTRNDYGVLSRSENNWGPRDDRVFVICNENNLFLSRNRMEDGRRMMELAELDLETEAIGETITMQTNIGKRYARKAGYPVAIDQSNVLFMEYNDKDRFRMLHFQIDRKPATCKVRQDGVWHYDENREYMFFHDISSLYDRNNHAYRMKEYSPQEFRPRFLKIRVADGDVVDEVRLENGEFTSKYEQEKGKRFLLPESRGNFQNYHHVVKGDHIYFVSIPWKDGQLRQPGHGVILKYPLEHPTKRTVIEFPFEMPAHGAGIHVDDRFVYYYGDQWIFRVRHNSDNAEPSRFGKTNRPKDE